MNLKNLTALLLGAAMSVAANAAETPAVTFTSSIYGSYGGSNSFHFTLGTTTETYVDVDCGYGPVEYLVTPPIWDEDARQYVGTAITCQVSSAGTVKIYCDPSQIEFFAADGTYMRTLDMTGCDNLWYLSLQHNELQSLDLTPFRNLMAVYLSDNPFTPETPLVVGPDKPYLSILEVDIVDYISPDFDIKTYGNLQSFDAYANKSLYHLDPTGCPELLRLSVDSCPISSLDLSKNTKLMILNIEDSRITDIDVSHCPNLQQLYARNESGFINTSYKLSSIDVTHNPVLSWLTLNGNNLTEIDLSKNPELSFLNIAGNLLTGINLDANTKLSTVNIKDNNMTFATLPLPDQNWYEYDYSQRPMAVSRSYPTGSVLDFSDKVLREGTSTDAVLYAHSLESNSDTPLDASYYTYANGKVTLLKEYRDSVFVSFANSAFPDIRLTTEYFKLKNAADFDKPVKIIEFSTGATAGDRIDLHIGLDGASASSPVDFFVDPGNGNLVRFTATSQDIPAAANASFARAGYGNVGVYIDGDKRLTAFAASGVPMYNLDVKAATELRFLEASDAGLYSIDLSYNRCLQSLDLSGNQFAAIDLSGLENGVYNKNVLSHINLSNNRISDLTLNDPRAITHLDLSNNRISEISLKDYDYMVDFNISGNLLTTANISYMTGARSVNLSNNALTELTLPETHTMSTLDISGNQFTLASLPLVSGGAGFEYIYAPQSQLLIPTKGPGIDLSAQNRIINGRGTTYIWKKADGTALTEGTDYTVTDGVTRFVNTSVGKIFCEMTNPAFPAFTGSNVFRTTLIEAAGMPTNCIASFTTAEDGLMNLSLAAAVDGTAIYFDWNGNGTDLAQYQLGTSYRLFSARTRANANVKVYTYDPSEKITVFSLNDAKLSRMDASGLKDVVALTVAGAGLSEITLPDAPAMAELNLEGNAFTSFDLSGLPQVRTLALNGNLLKELDLSKAPDIAVVGANDNSIETVKLNNNNKLWLLYIDQNQISSIDLSGAPNLEQLSMSKNQLESLDVSMLGRLRMLHIDRNRFVFTTLPPQKDSYYSYIYANQAPMDAEVNNGVVDLGSQAVVNGVETQYSWYLGVPEFDSEGTLQGELLYADDEYVISDGVTTFIKSFDGVMCVMTNSEFPKLYLYTDLLNVTAAGISDATVGGNDMSVTVNGDEITVTCDVPDGTVVALAGIDGRIAASARIADGQAVMRTHLKGAAVIAVGSRAAKVMIR